LPSRRRSPLLDAVVTVSFARRETSPRYAPRDARRTEFPDKYSPLPLPQESKKPRERGVRWQRGTGRFRAAEEVLSRR